MASFTDNSELLSRFNPYVQQLPVEAMVNVGIQKQQQYNEGVQKIQGQIDQIAGLDVVRDVDKQYLQSRLNNLGSDLKKVAAGDFSNYQLVNSVGGLASKIGKDANVQNAVASTSRYRKGVSDMETARKEGKNNPANEFNFNKKANDWLYSQNPKQPFNSGYTPYFDVDKFTKETFDAVKPDGYTFEQLYETDDNGNPLKDKTGKPILSPVLAKLKQEGRFPKKVEQTLDQIFSDARVNQQLAISGEYTYQGMTPQALQSNLTSAKEKQLAAYDEAIREVNLKKASGNKDPKLQEELDKLASNKLKISQQFEEQIALAGTNPDAIRGMLFKESVRDNYKAMYTNITEERTFDENPIWNQNFKMQQESNRVAERRDDLIYKYKALEMGERQHQDKMRLEIQKAAAEGKVLDGSSATQTFMPTGEIDMNDLFDRNYDNAALGYNSATNELLFSTVLNDEATVASMMKANKNMTREQAIENVIKNAAAEKGENVDQFRARWTLKALDELNRTNGGTAIIQAKLANYEKAKKAFDIHSEAKARVDEESPDLKNNFTKDLETITYGNKALTPQDQYDIAMAFNTNIFTDKNMKDEAKKAYKRLEAKGIDDSTVRFLGRSYKDMNPQPGAALAFKTLFESVAKPEFVQSVKDRSASIQRFYQFNPIGSTSVATDKAEVTKNRYDKIGGFVGDYARNRQNLSPGFSSASENMAAIANDPTKGTIKMETSKNEVSGKVNPKFVFYDNSGTFVGEMTVTPAEARSVGFNPEALFTNDNVKLAETKIAMTGTNTTNSGGLGSIEDPYTYRTNDVLYSKSDFPSLKNIKGIDVKANVAVDPATGNYYSYVYINQDGQEVVKPLSEAKPSMGEALQLLEGLTPQIIQAIISEK